jgi:hypothetical protein
LLNHRSGVNQETQFIVKWWNLKNLSRLKITIKIMRIKYDM